MYLGKGISLSLNPENLYLDLIIVSFAGFQFSAGFQKRF